MSRDGRYFTVEEADALVPVLAAGFTRILHLRLRLRQAGQELSALGEPTDAQSLGEREGGAPEAQSARARARGLLEALGGELQAVQGLGVEVKDLDVGLCDFVALHEGREILLCWKLGERCVGHWHEPEAGFAGRKPIDASFRVLH